MVGIRAIEYAWGSLRSPPALEEWLVSVRLICFEPKRNWRVIQEELNKYGFQIYGGDFHHRPDKYRYLETKTITPRIRSLQALHTNLVQYYRYWTPLVKLSKYYTSNWFQ